MFHQPGALLSTLLVWAGLAWAVVAVWRLLYSRSPGRSPSGAFTFVVPVVLLTGGFWVADHRYGWWLLLGMGIVLWLGMTARARYVTTPVTREGAAALAAVTAGGVLALFGVLLTLRLVVKPDPAEPFVAALRPDPLITGLGAVGVPLLGVTLAALGFRLVRRLEAGTRHGWLSSHVSAGYRRMHTIATDDGLRFGDSSDRWLVRHKLIWALLVVFMAVLFWLPLADGGSALIFFHAATPELAKLVFLVVMAVLVARVAHWFDSNHLRGTPGRRLRRSRYIIYPFTVLAVVVVVNGARHDFGTTVSLVAATVGITWATTRFSMLSKPDARQGSAVTLFRRQQGRTAAAYRPFIVVGAVLVMATLAVAFAVTGYAGKRGSTWQDPWRYRWDASCAAVGTADGAGPAGAKVGASAGGGTDGPTESTTSPVPQAPPGWQLCQRSAAVDAESGQSQIARALSAVADGGVFGRGLRDTASSYVPAASTDFVLVVVWQKLGAGAVVLTTALTVLLGLALPRAVRRRAPRPGAGPTPAELFAAGLGAMIVGQFLFVFAASVNFLPHSGLPAPLLSRGGQSNLAILLGLLVVLIAARAAATDDGPAYQRHRPAPAEPVPPRLPLLPRLRELPARQFGLLAPMIFCLAVVAVVTLMPYRAMVPPAVYGNERPLCRARGADHESLRMPPPDPRRCSTDRLAYDRTRIEIRFGDVPGLVQERPSGRWSVVPGPALSGLRADDLAGLIRLGWGDAGALDLSHPDVLAGTAGTRLDHRTRLPGGTRAADGWLSLTIDPALQHAVANAMRSSGPDRDRQPAGGAVVLDAASGRILAAVSTPAAAEAPPPDAPTAADRRAVADFERRHPDCVMDDGACWKWSIRPAVVAPAALSGPHRALGSRYALDDITSIVAAAAHLSRPGTTVDDSVAGVSACPGRTTIRTVIKAPCRDAAAALVRSGGWEPVAATARSLGLSTGDCAAESAPLTTPLVGSATTCVAAPPGSVTGNPLGLAALMAAVANDGVAMRPGLVAALRTPDLRHTRSPSTPEPVRALEPAVAASIADALRTTVDGRTVWLVSGETAGHRWSGGYLPTRSGNLAFASVVDDGPDAHLLLLEAVHRTMER
jgi:cell division protein FtsW (lipid II flippase)